MQLQIGEAFITGYYCLLLRHSIESQLCIYLVPKYQKFHFNPMHTIKHKSYAYNAFANVFLRLFLYFQTWNN